jgi:hypothetical protein
MVDVDLVPQLVKHHVMLPAELDFKGYWLLHES